MSATRRAPIFAALAGLHDSVRVRAVAGASGIYDLPSGAAANPVWAGVIPQYMGPYHYGYGSPVNLVSRGDPPVLLVHGRQDSVVAPSQSSHMASRLEGELVPRLLRTYDGGHDMFYPGSPAYRAVMTDVLGFLLYWTSS